MPNQEDTLFIEKYSTVWVFFPNSKLHAYLALKCPEKISLHQNEYVLFNVMLAFKTVITKEKMLDPNNRPVIICSKEMETALDVKALHANEIQQQVCKQMVQKDPLTRQHIPELAAILAAVQPRTTLKQAFDINASYRVKPDFLEVLRSVSGVDQTKDIFEYREICKILSVYLLSNKDRFFDYRNTRVALIENDQLEKAFNVKAFHRSQVASLIIQQLIPLQPTENSPPPIVNEPGNQLNNINRVECEIDDDSNKEDCSLDSSNDESNIYRVEYEIDDSSDNSSDKESRPPASSNDESEIEDVVLDEVKVNSFDPAILAESDSSNSSEKPVKQKRYQRRCYKCDNNINSNLMYCNLCWRKIKSWVPERQNPRKRKRCESIVSKQESKRYGLVIPKPSLEQGASIGIVSPDKTTTEKLCSICFTREKDASFVHGRISHQTCCYRCAKTVFKSKQPCPICRRKIEKITKVICV